MSETAFEYTLKLNIPFENEKQSKIAKSTLLPDPVLKPTELQIEYEAKDNNLLIFFKSTSNRVLRVGVNSTIESLKTIIECMDEFDGKKDILSEQEQV